MEEAFIYEQTIDHATYDRQRDRLQEALPIAKLHDARIGTLALRGSRFRRFLIENAARVWQEASLRQRQQIQSAIFPEGLPFDGREFGTAPTCLAFMQLQSSEAVEVASPTIPSWNQIANFLESMRQLKNSVGFAA